MTRRLFGSVRSRATLAATLVVAVALLATGAALLLSLRSDLTGQAETEAASAARAVAVELSDGRPYDKLTGLDEDDRPVQIVDERGRVVAASEDLERVSGTGTDAVRPGRDAGGRGAEDGDDGDDGDDDGNDGDDGDSGRSGSGDSDDDRGARTGEVDSDTDYSTGTATIDGTTADYRFASVEVEFEDRGKLTVHAGAPLAAERSAVGTATTAMLIGFPLLLAVVAGATWLVTRRALNPVEGIRREMAAITASEDLARRVPVPATHDEVARLALTTNETLAALESSVERQRRFVADASHELRSPIASLRTQLEVGAAHPGLLDLDGAVADTVRLQTLAADLLLLARLDAGERPGDARFDLGALAREHAEGRAGVTVTADAVPVAGSRAQVGRVLTNLLDNALRHARSAVTVSVRAEGEWAVAAVADDGDGVPEADRERIFERFVRLDEARSRDDGGAGLGLAIARDVAVRHGGALTVGRAPAGGALFELRLPRAR
ncbi:MULTISPECIES: sensor histidine kinase [unclassified Streptomyces]|uniref:sensor histidine kinase n=1 Tax=unclassified Streptomyces TaxID=2593676 RepID=UPI0007486A66|nr:MULTISPECIES: HAMP domain-containing sensor histidine kinase [unclassified Streptomyces]KUL76135.1 histidine kinase [Streptomyces sp. NRRL WC-3605]KUL77190.1 histidine kinase [Streptomyces sp. NRRL WC-3604]